MNTETIDRPDEKIEEEQPPKEGQAPEEGESGFGGKKHFPIFPTNLFEFHLKEEDSDKASGCLPALNELLGSEEDHPNWATQPNLNTLDEFKDVTSLFSVAAEEVLGFSGVRYDNLLITSVRAYRYTKPELGPMEQRPNNLLSGLLFLETDDNGRATFFDPRPQAWIIKPPISQANIFNSDAFSVEFKKNKMLLFPAWLQYQVGFKEEMKGANTWLTWTAMVRGGGPKESD